jgi:hypothetical protein
MQSDAILPGQSVVIVDDLIATGKSRLSSSGAVFHTFFRGLGQGSWRARQEARRGDSGVSLHYRDNVP